MKARLKTVITTSLMLWFAIGADAEVSTLTLHADRPADESRAIPRDTTFTLHSTALKVRKRHPEAEPVYPTPTDGITSLRDIVYAEYPSTPFGRRQILTPLFKVPTLHSYSSLPVPL